MDSVLHNGTVHGTAFRKAGVLDIRGCVCVSITNIIQQMAFRKSLPIYSCFKCGVFSHCCTLVAPLVPSKGLRRLRCVES